MSLSQIDDIIQNYVGKVFFSASQQYLSAYNIPNLQDKSHQTQIIARLISQKKSVRYDELSKF